jgi:hypothetical protein
MLGLRVMQGEGNWLEFEAPAFLQVVSSWTCPSLPSQPTSTVGTLPCPASYVGCPGLRGDGKAEITGKE